MTPEFAPEERLLVLASLAAPDAAEREEAVALAGRVTSWPRLADLAADNATAPLVAWNLGRFGIADRLPAPVAERFRAASERIRAANEARLEWGRRLFERFTARGIRVVLLKGVLFAETIYRNPHYKKMNDIDVLVRREDLDGALGLHRREKRERVPTVAGLLLLGRESALREHLPTHEAAFQVLEGTHVRVNEFYRAPLLKTFEPQNAGQD